MNKIKIQERILLLTEKKELFLKYLDLYYKDEKFFGPSVYFHQKVIELIRKTNNYSNLIEDTHFLEYIYATLASWGMHRMGPKGSKMTEFNTFKESIKNNKDLILDLHNYKINTISEDEFTSIKSKLVDLFEGIKIMQSGSNLVGNSKVMHHLIPDLIPPIDRQYTLRFFYGSFTSKYTPIFNKDEETDIFSEIVSAFHIISHKLKLSSDDFDFTKSFNTSIPKIIDNVIIALIQNYKSNNSEP